ncbi:MAG TPA: L-histidine N(alpha)-methyltransferase [Acidobacteriaceae bacterium]|nr:L-histidine N(alpha)-methyltransferase [Acidobacteriaceae bacterium]
MPTATRDTALEAVLDSALTGLTAPRKTLPPWLFYDRRGSQLFEQITELPEYYLTRTERAILAQYAPEIPSLLIAAVTVAELGAGSASKTGILLQEFAASQSGLLYQPIDISPSALDEAAVSLRAAIPGLTVQPQVANYITDRYTIARPEDHIVLALYIGSSIGNFAPPEAAAILRNLRGHLQPGDALLLGADLAPGERKSIATLLAAYDDAAGVTAAFNKNILVRLNRELDANFDIDAFAHRARWNAAESRIEMHLESLIAQTARVAGEDIVFARGETIHTENSYKFTADRLATLLAGSGFSIDHVMHDDDHRFAVTLAEAV